MASLLLPLFFLVKFCVYPTTTAPTWFPGFMKQVSAKGNNLWGVDPLNRLFKWQNNAWTYLHLEVGASYVAVASDGTAYVIRTTSCSIIYYPAIADFNSDANICSVSGALMVSAESVSSAVYTGTNGELIHYKDFNFFQINSTQSIIQAAIGDNGEMWMIDANNNVFRYTGGKWVQMSGWGIFTIDVQSANRIVVTNWEYLVYKWNGAGWTKVDGLSDCRQATINYVSIFCVTTKGAIFKVDI